MAGNRRPDVKHADVVRERIDCFNAADVDGLMTLYAEDAVNHQVVMEPLEGCEAIRAMFEVECGFFRIENERIVAQRGYFDQLSFFRSQRIPVPDEYLGS